MSQVQEMMRRQQIQSFQKRAALLFISEIQSIVVLGNKLMVSGTHCFFTTIMHSAWGHTVVLILTTRSLMK